MTWDFWSHDLWRRYCDAYGHGYTDNQSIRGNLVIPLSSIPDEMYGRLSKGHKADVKYAASSYDETWGNFDVYEQLHKAAHPNARSQQTYDIMREMCDAGIAVPIAALSSDHPVAAALFFVLGEGSYYASAARCREHVHRGAAHLLVWRAMVAFGANGVLWMDCGPVPPTDADEKAVNVAKFKAHFGAAVPNSSGPVVMNGD